MLPFHRGAGRFGLCADCRASISPPATITCRGCGAPLRSQREPVPSICGSCLNHPPPFDSLHYLYDYREPIASVIRALKFQGLEYLGDDLARALLDRWQASPTVECDLVTAVPLSRRRLCSRGYKQALAIARPLARGLGRPLRHLLRRRGGAKQALSTREERLGNLSSSFSMRRCAVPRGSRILLVDDVTTTGATLEAATRVLLEGGAESVVAMVFARTPTWQEDLDRA